MKICCVGAGYIGVPGMAVMARNVPDIRITVVDLDEARITAWNTGPPPVYEPGLEEIVNATRGRNLFFSTNVKAAMAESDIIFVAVGTPAKQGGNGTNGVADLRNVEAVARMICEVATSPKIIVEKSTTPVRTAEAIQQILAANCASTRCQVLSNPEFSAQGSAVADLQDPDRVLIGGETTTDGEYAVAVLASLYARWVPRARILVTSLWSAELSKLVANAFLAQRISSINSVAALCEATGADVGEVAVAVGRDTRIGPEGLRPSVGFGGASFRKDILNLVYLCEHYGLQMVAAYWEQVVRMNDWQKQRFSGRIVRALFNTLAGKRIAVLGFAFKPDTDDVRESPAISVVRDLLAEQAEVAVFDPRVPEERIREALVEAGADTTHLTVVPDALAAAAGAHALVILTEWAEFAALDYTVVLAGMNRPAFVFDGRNLLDLPALRRLGFEAHGIGK